ncbi:hypothetical protein P7C70_g6772, partial [Phenoliferia sp. Uapishka_3]
MNYRKMPSEAYYSNRPTASSSRLEPVIPSRQEDDQPNEFSNALQRHAPPAVNSALPPPPPASSIPTGPRGWSGRDRPYKPVGSWASDSSQERGAPYPSHSGRQHPPHQNSRYPPPDPTRWAPVSGESSGARGKGKDREHHDSGERDQRFERFRSQQARNSSDAGSSKPPAPTPTEIRTSSTAAAASREREHGPRKLEVKGYSPRTTKDELEALFRLFGSIDSVKLTHSRSGAFASVLFQTPAAAKSAMEALNGTAKLGAINMSVQPWPNNRYLAKSSTKPFLVVQNIGRDTQVGEVRNAFEPYGKIYNIDIKARTKKRKRTQMAEIEFDESADLLKAYRDWNGKATLGSNAVFIQPPKRPTGRGGATESSEGGEPPSKGGSAWQVGSWAEDDSTARNNEPRSYPSIPIPIPIPATANLPPRPSFETPFPSTSRLPQLQDVPPMPSSSSPTTDTFTPHTFPQPSSSRIPSSLGCVHPTISSPQPPHSPPSGLSTNRKESTATLPPITAPRSVAIASPVTIKPLAPLPDFQTSESPATAPTFDPDSNEDTVDEGVGEVRLSLPEACRGSHPEALAARKKFQVAEYKKVNRTGKTAHDFFFVGDELVIRYDINSDDDDEEVSSILLTHRQPEEANASPPAEASVESSPPPTVTATLPDRSAVVVAAIVEHLTASVGPEPESEADQLDSDGDIIMGEAEVEGDQKPNVIIVAPEVVAPPEAADITAPILRDPPLVERAPAIKKDPDSQEVDELETPEPEALRAPVLFPYGIKESRNDSDLTLSTVEPFLHEYAPHPLCDYVSPLMLVNIRRYFVRFDQDRKTLDNFYTREAVFTLRVVKTLPARANGQGFAFGKGFSAVQSPTTAQTPTAIVNAIKTHVPTGWHDPSKFVWDAYAMPRTGGGRRADGPAILIVFHGEFEEFPSHIVRDVDRTFLLVPKVELYNRSTTYLIQTDSATFRHHVPGTPGKLQVDARPWPLPTKFVTPVLPPRLENPASTPAGSSAPMARAGHPPPPPHHPQYAAMIARQTATI